MFNHKIVIINNIEQYTFYYNDKIISCKRFIKLLKNRDFIKYLSSTLANTKYYNNYLNCTILKDKLKEPLVINLIQTYEFSEKTDYKLYQEYMNTTKQNISFLSLTEKHILVVPHPINGENDVNNYKNYRHFYGFLNNALEEKIIDFWQKIRKITKKLIFRNKDVYYITHGRDVPYLHFKIKI